MNGSGQKRHRSREGANKLVGFSLSYQRANMLARGLGFEHLRELVVRIARPLLRQGTNLAYGGKWQVNSPDPENFTQVLVQLISAEQEDRTIGDAAESKLAIGRLFNHSAWPNYLQISRRDEAQYINVCRIVRITQQMAGLGGSDVVPDQDASSGSDRSVFNAAVTLSAMRAKMCEELQLSIPGLAETEPIPALHARIVFGGKVGGYTGFLPGIFEETLRAMERNLPIYLLGGFGGATEILAKALIDTSTVRPPELDPEWHAQKNPTVVRLLGLIPRFGAPPDVRTTAAALNALWGDILAARSNLAGALNTGLEEADTRTLLTTRDPAQVVQLVHKGLRARGLLRAATE